MEVDITKPLLSKFKVRRRICRIKYDGIHMVCFQCGIYGNGKKDFQSTSSHANSEQVLLKEKDMSKNSISREGGAEKDKAGGVPQKD